MKKNLTPLTHLIPTILILTTLTRMILIRMILKSPSPSPSPSDRNFSLRTLYNC